MKDEMPEVIVTGALDAADVRDMMLYIQEPELWEDDETPPTIGAVVINPLDVAVEALVEAVALLNRKADNMDMTGDLYKLLYDLETSVELVVSLMEAGKEVETNE